MIMKSCFLGLVTSLLCINLFSKPNIILFLVDDMGLMDTSVPMLANKGGKPQKHPLNEWYRTPSMERLAKQGVRFSQFYAQSVCSPTRVSLMTGQNSARHRVTQFISPESKNSGPEDWKWEGLTSKDITLPSILRANGYHTIFAGKAHFAPIGYEGENPSKLGFDINIAGCSFGAPGSYFGEHGYGSLLDPVRKRRAVPGLKQYHKTNTFLSEAITLEAKKAVTRSIEKNKPFFLYMSHYAVHSPFQSDPRFIENYAKSNKPRPAKSFATLIEGIDKSLGDLMDHVAEKGVAENTLILFVGDNGSDGPLGDSYGHFSSAPLRGKKGTCYEGGLRVPFIGSWAKAGKKNPFKIARNHLHYEQIGTVMDIYSTIVDASNSSTPAKHPVDGVSLLPQLSGQTNQERPDHFMCHFPHSHRSSYFTSYRKGDWKLIYRYLSKSEKGKEPAPQYELYHLGIDPYETQNLAFEDHSTVNKMVHHMTQQLENEGALFPMRGDRELKPKEIK